MFLVAFAMFGFFMIIRSNIELSAARSEVARLAAENERTRIARDLHDLLGHSLTTITVKAGLARRLSTRDPERAAEEIAAVEQLSRRTLVEVRAAVAGYREVTLAGELASAREVLRAAGIEARLPGAVDAVDADAVEPFGWVVREAVTNVVRHSRAEHCTITVGPRWIEIADDGRGACTGGGAGQRAARPARAAGGRRRHGHRAQHGTRLDAAGRAGPDRGRAGRTRRRPSMPDRPVPPARSGCCSPTTRPSCARRWPRCSNSRTTSRSSRRPAAATRWWRPRWRPVPTSRCSTSRCPAWTGWPPRPR